MSNWYDPDHLSEGKVRDNNVHENPSISGKSKEKLKKDMAITVEPGIYIPKRFGIRIEDSLIVKDKAAVMHKFTKDLIVI